MRTTQECFWVLLLALALGGCASPFAQSVNYDPISFDKPGTVTLSDGKAYSRELLLNERAQEVAWLNGLIDESKERDKIKFTPDLIRETEQIWALSASLGLKVDPAAGLNYRRAEETSGIQQQIDTLKLKAQLEQLQHDVDLLSEVMKEQKTQVNENIGKLGDGSVGQATSQSTQASLADLKTLLESTLKALADRLDKAATLPAAANASVSPFDDFQDRSAYRAMLKSARNAAALDENHDANGTVLIRLNFQATVLPDPTLPNSLGAVQVKVLPPASGDGADSVFLDDWLLRTNLSANDRGRDGAFVPGGSADIIGRRGAFADWETDTKLKVLVPNLVEQGGRPLLVRDLIKRAHWIDMEGDEDAAERAVGDVNSTLSIVSNDKLAAWLCRGKVPTSEAEKGAIADLGSYRQLALDRVRSFPFLELADRVRVGLKQPASPLQNLYLAKNRFATIFLHNLAERLAQLAFTDAQCHTTRAKLVAEQSRFPWQALMRAPLRPDQGQVRIYDVAPREQVQQVSTVARSANSVALAAQLAASAPGSGVAGDAAVGFSRSAMGRAAAIDRVPRVVGYSIGANQTFGWVIGPKATIDPRGRVTMLQTLQAADVSVDLSIPVWWNEVRLAVQPVWAPSPEKLVEGVLRLEPQKPAPGEPLDPRVVALQNSLGSAEERTKRHVQTVPLRHPEADFDRLTHLFADAGEQPVDIKDVVGTVNDCDQVTLIVRGWNMWRAQSVFVMGQKITSDKIAILPDMGGIEVTVPAITLKKELQTPDRMKIIIVTPAGKDEQTINYLGDPAGDACKPTKEDKAADPNAIQFTSYSELKFVAPANFMITVRGKNLQKVDGATLYGQPVKVSPGAAADGTSLTISITESDSKGIPTSDNVKLVLLSKNKPVDTQTVVVLRNSGT